MLNGLEDPKLVDLMKAKLEHSKYLIVLDNIWSIEVWSSIQSAFPNGRNGSKVVYTMRIKDVVCSADP